MCLLYLTRKQNIKGGDIIYSDLETKWKNECVCSELETMKHNYVCETLNGETKPKTKYEKIYNGEIEEQIEVFRKFEENLEKREKLKNPPRDPSICDLLVSVENSFG